MSTERFPGIPEPQIIEPDYSGDLARMKQTYFEKTGHHPGISDPETFLLEQIAYERSNLVDEINYEAKQNLLTYADDERLDSIGLMVGATRLPASSALINERLTLSEHAGFVLAAGFEVRAIDGSTIFRTIEDVAVEVGIETIDITMECESTGEDGNGFTEGQVTEIVTAGYPIDSATNTTASAGGGDIESNDAFAYRIYLAPSQFSVCGPYDAYEYFALSANAAIASVYVHNPAPNEIELYALLSGGVLPTDPIKEQILAQCTGEKRVPMGDLVSVKDPTAIIGTVSCVITVFKDYEALASSITESASSALESLLTKWRSQSGRDIVIGALEAPVQSIAGVYNAKVTVTVDDEVVGDIMNIDKTAFPNLTLTNVTFDITTERSEDML